MPRLRLMQLTITDNLAGEGNAISHKKQSERDRDAEHKAAHCGVLLRNANA